MDVSQIRIAIFNKLAGTHGSKMSTVDYFDLMLKANEIDQAANQTLTEAPAIAKSVPEYLEIVEQAEQYRLEDYLELCKEYNIDLPINVDNQP